MTEPASGRAARVIARGLSFPEGPLFDAQGDLWCVEMKGGGLARVDRAGLLTRFATGGAPNGLALDAAGGIWFCDSDLNQIRRLDPTTGACETIAGSVEGHDLDKPNDLAFDSVGNLVFTCPGNSREAPTGYVCCLTPSGDGAVIADDLYFPNGLAFAADGALVIAETRRQRLWCGDWDAGQRRWISPVQLCATSGAPIGPDGLAIDIAGRIHVAIYGASRVEVFAADGARLGALTTPGANPSNCAFDPTGQLGLVVTETERGELLSFPADAVGLPLALGAPPHSLAERAHVH
ncbi:SMP-30/gluconolactonase/LRE family protein [soil metagenome]